MTNDDIEVIQCIFETSAELIEDFCFMIQEVDEGNINIIKSFAEFFQANSGYKNWRN